MNTHSYWIRLNLIFGCMWPSIQGCIALASQVERFAALVNALREQDYYPKAHIIGTFGLLHCPTVGGDYARIGMAMYGILTRRIDIAQYPATLKPVLSLKTRVISIRTVQKGEYVGYGFAYQADRERRIATLSIGYANK